MGLPMKNDRKNIFSIYLYKNFDRRPAKLEKALQLARGSPKKRPNLHFDRQARYETHIRRLRSRARFTASWPKNVRKMSQNGGRNEKH